MQLQPNPYGISSPRRISTVSLASLSPPGSSQLKLKELTECDKKLFLLCGGGSHGGTATRVLVLGLNNEQLQQGHDIIVGEITDPVDMAACTATRQLYIADKAGGLWRVPVGSTRSDGCIRSTATSIQLTVSAMKISALSVTSRRLLVTCSDELVLFSIFGEHRELQRVSSPEFKGLKHAVGKAPLHHGGTIVVSHLRPQPQISEVDVASGAVLRFF